MDWQNQRNQKHKTDPKDKRVASSFRFEHLNDPRARKLHGPEILVSATTAFLALSV